MLSCDFLTNTAKAVHAYEASCSVVCRRYHLTQTGLDILLFLANHPSHNTAHDICRIRGIKSGIASVTVESLIQAGYLVRCPDTSDRRIRRLAPTPQADALISAGRAVQREYLAALFSGISPAEREVFTGTLEKMAANIRRMDSAPAAETFPIR